MIAAGLAASCELRADRIPAGSWLIRRRQGWDDSR